MTMNKSSENSLSMKNVKLRTPTLRGAAWPVYEDYDLRVVDGEPVLYAAGSEPSRSYVPLRDTPTLFLDFARLPDENREGIVGPQEMMGWVRHFGLLGVGREESVSGIPTNEIGPVVTHGSLRPEDAVVALKGVADGGEDPTSVGDGRAESLSRFSGAIDDARRGLRLYEAATDTGELGADRLRGMHPQGDATPLDELRREALAEADRYVAHYLESETYLTSYRRDDGTHARVPSTRSLLGAMWLQMSFLMEAGENVTRCRFEGCINIVDYEKPPPEALPSAVTEGTRRRRGRYKTRKDKGFCSDNCRAKQHYRDKKRRKEREA